MRSTRPNIEHVPEDEIAAAEFPELSPDELRALIESLDRASEQIANGDFIEFEPEKMLAKLKAKYSSK